MKAVAYDTMVEALHDLAQQGYTTDFNLLPDCLECDGSRIQPTDFQIVGVHRFEGMSSADDNSVLYVIETNDGQKGTLVDAYGTYASNLTDEMIQKLRYKAPGRG